MPVGTVSSNPPSRASSPETPFRWCRRDLRRVFGLEQDHVFPDDIGRLVKVGSHLIHGCGSTGRLCEASGEGFEIRGGVGRTILGTYHGNL
jgi:hypothetical protein